MPLVVADMSQALTRIPGWEPRVSLDEGLAASIRSDEEKMLNRILGEIPRLSDAVVGAEIEDDPSYDVTTTGAADAVRGARRSARTRTTKTAASAKRTARKARTVAQAAQAKNAGPAAGDLAIEDYDELAPHEITTKLPQLSQTDLGKIDAYERKNQNRTQVLTRLETLRANEPWTGYDELTADEVIAVLSEGDDDRTDAVQSYERTHKNRVAILHAAARVLAHA